METKDITFITQSIEDYLKLNYFLIVFIQLKTSNNLLNRKKFVFPTCSLHQLEDIIDILEGFISWKMSYNLQEKDDKLERSLKITPKLS